MNEDEGCTNRINHHSIPGTLYRLSLMTTVISSYTNRCPWSIRVGAQAIASGIGSAFPWTVVSRDFTCSSLVDLNKIEFVAQADINRQMHLRIRDVVVTPL